MLRFRILTGTTFTQIGEVVLLDATIKNNILNGGRERYIFLYYENFYDNKYLIDLYRDYIYCVKNKMLLILFLLLSHSLILRLNVTDLDTNCRTCRLTDILNLYRRHYEYPVIKMPENDIRSCRHLLKNLIGKQNWVCIHAREAGYKNNIYKDGKRRTRNADITTYKKAIRLLIALGYVVVRMGDRWMKSTSDLERDFGRGYFDYAHSDLKSAVMDTYLFSHCAFAIVCTSGPSEVPSIFNRRILTVNGYSAVNSLRFYRGDCAIFKKHRNVKTGRYLNLERLFKPPFDKPLQAEDAISLGYELEDNTEDEIHEAVKAFLRHTEAGEELELGKDYSSLIKRHHYCFSSQARFADSFIEHYIKNQEGLNDKDLP